MRANFNDDPEPPKRSLYAGTIDSDASNRVDGTVLMHGAVGCRFMDRTRRLAFEAP